MMPSTKGRYALRAVMDIAEHAGAGHVALKSVAERQCISGKYLEAIAKSLVDAGILKSVRGKGGGYLLARPADAITAGDVIRAAEGDVAAKPCVLPNGSLCDRANDCQAYCFWAGLEGTINDYIDGVTISELISKDRSEGNAD